MSLNEHEEFHQRETLYLDPSRPCRYTHQCTQPWCGKVFSTGDNHHWSYWELTDPATDESTRYCHNPRCTGEEKKHEHQWEVIDESVSYEIDWDQETSHGVRQQERQCKTCQATETIEV